MSYKKNIRWIERDELMVGQQKNFDQIVERAKKAKLRVKIWKTAGAIGSAAALSVAFWVVDVSPQQEVIREPIQMEELSNSLAQQYRELPVPLPDMAKSDVRSDHQPIESQSTSDLEQKKVIPLIVDEEKVPEQLEKLPQVDPTPQNRELVAEENEPDQHKDTSKGLSVYIDAQPSVGYDSLYRYLYEGVDTKVTEDQLNTDQLEIYFYIEEDGRPSDIQISGVESDTVVSLIRKVVSQMPDWQPAMVNEKPVKRQFMLPLRFRKEE
ncbi:hypothetical protein [Marinoscillum sp.]|uniref:hypothetical protein n=1 Tax=Marinoscillum sp. TaxID=2024838 RepID=UPI003BADAE63